MKMVGLSVVLEAQKGSSISKKTPQVINKTTMMLGNGDISKSSAAAAESSCQHSVFQAPTFLDQCFLCRKRLLPGKDIFMYQGDRAFCSVECRYKQILADEEESFQRENCSFAAMRPTSSASSSASSTPRHHRKGPRNRYGAFAC